MSLAPPKAAPLAFLDEAGCLRRRGKATLAAARAAAAAVASAPSADVETFANDDDGKGDAASSQQQPKETAPSLFNDLLCLKTMWFQKASGDTHEERLSSFYAPQADACKFFDGNQKARFGTFARSSTFFSHSLTRVLAQNFKSLRVDFVI